MELACVAYSMLAAPVALPFEFVVELLGIADVQRLAFQLLAIKTYKRPDVIADGAESSDPKG